MIEVLVALALWGLLTVLMSRGLDVVLRSQHQQGERDAVQARLQNCLSQWQADLQQIDTQAGIPAGLDWNGQILRLVRYSTYPNTGYRQVVAWGLREGRWVRWQSGPLSQRAEVAEAWQKALDAYTQAGAAWDSNSGIQATQWLAVPSWRVFFFRNDSWSNALSSSGTGPAMPDAVRLELELAPQGPWSGLLRSDWVRPTWSVNRS